MSTEPPATCPGCGIALPHRDGPVHAYLGASPECWALYGEVLAREYSAQTEHPRHHLTVDAYAVQHPGVPERRAMQSVCIHLMRLCLLLERDADPPAAARMMARILERRPALRWLEPPLPNGTVTVADIAAATDTESHRLAVERWSADLWQAWAAHHATVRQWLAETRA